MTTEKTIWYDTLSELEAALDNLPKNLTVLPADSPSRLCKGFVVFNSLAKNEVEENAELHTAPIYDSKEECRQIDHDTFESWVEAIDDLTEQTPEIVAYPADDPKRLRLGYAFHPQREWHTVKLNALKGPEYDEKLSRLRTALGLKFKH